MDLIPPFPLDYININLNTQKDCMINDQMLVKVAAAAQEPGALWKAAAAAEDGRWGDRTARLFHAPVSEQLPHDCVWFFSRRRSTYWVDGMLNVLLLFRSCTGRKKKFPPRLSVLKDFTVPVQSWIPGWILDHRTGKLCKTKNSTTTQRSKRWHNLQVKPSIAKNF